MIIQENRQTWQSPPAPPSVVRPDPGYRVQISSELEDRAWDTFLAQTPGGHHLQTSLWAQVKALLGWRVARIVMRRGEQIVAGAQILLRSVPLNNAIGFVFRGPLFAVDDPVLTTLVRDTLHQVAKEYRIQYLVVQPAYTGEAVAEQLPGWGFQPSTIEFERLATVLVDLTPDLDSILARMRKTTRQAIRSGLRKGVTVREGSEADLPTFYRLHTITNQRQGFLLHSEEFIFHLWRTFAAHGHIKLFLAEYQGETVSAALFIPFGDTALGKLMGWSGLYSNLHPNEVLYFEKFKWARAQGLRYFDLDGIEPGAARATMQGDCLSEANLPSWNMFKLKFGGQAVLLPQPYDYVYNPFLRWSYNSFVSRGGQSSMMFNAIMYMRKHWINKAHVNHVRS